MRAPLPLLKSEQSSSRAEVLHQGGMFESPEDFQEIPDSRVPPPPATNPIQNLVGGEGQQGETTSLFTFFLKGLGIYNGQLGLRTSFKGL